MQSDRETILQTMLNSGVWPFLRQRPYGIIARPEQLPKSIFISAFDSNPLAPDYNFIMQGNDSAFQTGLNALLKLTPGKLHINIRAGTTTAPLFFKPKE